MLMRACLVVSIFQICHIQNEVCLLIKTSLGQSIVVVGSSSRSFYHNKLFVSVSISPLYVVSDYSNMMAF